MKNGIYIVATPIGNLKDISERAKDVLQNADIIACEDTRVTKKLFSLLGLNTRKKFIRLDDNTESEQSKSIINMVLEGKSVAQVSDAGSPLISDPGYKLIRLCKKQNVDVFVIPGACALICALQLSGLPTNSFMFNGFIPNKDKARKDLFESLKNINTTLVFYETANRIEKTLKIAKDIFTKREIAVAREITKIFEECINGTADELLCHFEKNPPKGEMVLMIAPPNQPEAQHIDIFSVLREKLKNTSLKSAVKEMVDEYGFNKNEIYNLALKIKDE